jgi:hypothetical protein
VLFFSASMDRLVLQGFWTPTMMDGAKAYADSQMLRTPGISPRASSVFCSRSAGTWARLILRARGWLPRFGRTKVDPYEGSGTRTGNGGGGSVETGGAVEVSGPSQDRGKKVDMDPFLGGGVLV